MPVNMLDAYIRQAPNRQNVIDLFQGEWSSAMPSGNGLLAKPGSAGLFEDSRIAWAERTLGGFSGNRVLKLGPLEGGHSFMLQQAGARQVISIEANSRAFLKCLCTKELFGLDRVKFLLGDFVAYLDADASRYDAVIASGVLYHMTDPADLLKRLSKVTDRLFIWTHYYDQQIISGAAHLRRFFEAPSTIDIAGSAATVARKRYDDALEWQGFCGGSEPYAIWMARSAIVDLLKAEGFQRLEIAFDQPDHPNGPAFALCAIR